MLVLRDVPDLHALNDSSLSQKGLNHRQRSNIIGCREVSSVNTYYPPFQGTFEDDFDFPMVAYYVSFLEGTLLMVTSLFRW